MAKWRKFRGAKLPRTNYNRFISQGTSKEELEIANFLQLELPRHKVYRGDRVVLQGKEIDIYVPSLKFGIEFHGNFFHKEKEPDYHLNKAILAEKAGVYLIQIFEDEWLHKRALVIDLIRKAIGKYVMIEASCCECRKLSQKEAGQFFSKTHLLGAPDNLENCLGLFYKNDLIYVCALQSDDQNITVLRDSMMPGIFVHNGLLKVLQETWNEKGLKPVYLELDRRLFDGHEYKELGFKEYACTPPNIYYSADFEERIPKSRMTEAMLNNGDEWFVYYDAGNRKLLLK